MIEILAVLAIILTLLAIVVPQIAGRPRDAAAAALLSDLTTAADAASRFKADVRRYPGQLAFLTDTATATPTDLCGDLIPPVLRRRWGGPYLQTRVTGDGIRVGSATIINTVARVPADDEVANLVLIATDVEEHAATRIEGLVDDGDFATGSVLWFDGGNDTGALLFLVPIRGC